MKEDQYIQCRSCGVVPYRAKRDIAAGDHLAADDFEGVNGFATPQPGDSISCPSCGGDLFYDVLIVDSKDGAQ